MWPHQGRSDGEDNIPWPDGHSLLNSPQHTMGLLGHTPHCNMLFAKTPTSFSTVLLSNSSAPNLYAVISSRCQIVHLPFLNLPNFPACLCLPEWQHSLLVCQSLLPVSYDQQTCWGHRWWCKTRLSTDHWWAPLGLQLDSVLLLSVFCTLSASQFSIHLSQFSVHHTMMFRLISQCVECLYT